jgi:hypothetical protein
MNALQILALTCTLLTVSHAIAVNTPLSATGYDADEIFENAANTYATSTDGHPDPTGTDWFEAGLDGYQNGLPVSGTITASGSGTVFQLQPYGSNGVPSNNALRIFDGGTGALTLTAPVPLVSLSILAFTASGTATDTGLPLTIHFTDGSSLQTTYNAPDWGYPSNAIYGLGRSATSGTTFTYDASGLSYGMTETSLDLTAYDTKSVQSLTFTAASDFTTYTTTSVMAISGTAAPEPTSTTLLISALSLSASFLRPRLKQQR